MLKRRILSMLLVAVMVVGMLPANAVAVDTAAQPSTLDGRTYTLTAEGGVLNNGTQVFGKNIQYTLSLGALEGENEQSTAPEPTVAINKLSACYISKGTFAAETKQWQYTITATAESEISENATLTVTLGSDSVTADFTVDATAPDVQVEWSEPEGEGENAEMIATVKVTDSLPVTATYEAKAGNTDVDPSVDGNTYTFSFGGQNECTLKFTATDAVGNARTVEETNMIDTTVPEIVGKAYVAAEKVVVDISYTVGLSGVKTVLVDGVDVTAQCSNNGYTGTVEGKKAGDEISVQVTGNNGKTASQTLKVVDVPTISVIYTRLGETDTEIYLGNDSTITLKVYNLISEEPQFTVTDGNNAVPLEWAKEADCWKATIKVAKETNLPKLTVQVNDGEGRTAEHEEKKIIKCDAMKPTIEVTNMVDGKPNDEVWVNEEFETVITIQDDVALKVENITVTNNGDEVALTGNNGSYTATIKVSEGETLKLKITATDNGGNTATYESPTVIVDKILPVVTVETDAQNCNGAEKTIKFTVSEANIDTKTITVSYEDGEPKDIKLEEDSTSKYTGSLTIKDGQVITDIKIQVKDKANNKPEVIDCTNAANISFADTDKDGIFNLNSGEILVDMTAPVVTVERAPAEGGSMYVYNGVEYHNGAVTYTVTVKDQFIDTNAVLEAYASYQGKTEPVRVIVAEDWDAGEDDQDLLGDDNTYEGSFTVENGQVLTDIKIVVKDAGGNVPEKIDGFEKVETTDETYFVWNADQKPVCVDTAGPQVEISFSENVVTYYTNDGKTFVKLDTSVVDGNEEPATVEMYVQITDANITMDTDSEYFIASTQQDDNGIWSTLYEDQNTVLTYMKTVEVEADSTGSISFALSIFDLAGNPVGSVDVVHAKDDTTLPEFAQPSDAPEVSNGTISGTIIVDRRRPEGVENNAPTLTIEGITGAQTGVTKDDLPIYSDDLTYSVQMRDIDKADETAATENSSGIKSMTWKIENAGEIIKTKEGSVSYEKYTCNEKATIAVDVDGIGESNNVLLTINVEDNVGNVSTYEISFALDNKVPSIKVNYNNPAGNSPFFKETRTATITVEDINWNENATNIGIEGPTAKISAWTENGNEHICTVEYAAEGDYEFAVSSTDLAGKVSSASKAGVKGDVTIDGPDNAYFSFTIDKTAPKISVTYDPATPVDKDELGVEYFDQNRTATVQITERNFDGADLSEAGWSTNWRDRAGDIHEKSAIFTEGNEYLVEVSCTDKAGNVAEPYKGTTFSVDLTAPTIEITKGTMTNETLNIVQGDLELGFTINDGQDNLKEFYVTMKHLNGQFQQVEVSGSEYYTLTNVDDRTTGYVDITNLVKEKANDGIYCIQVTAVDYAAHTVSLTPELYISVNRFGSSFVITDEYTRSFLTGQNGSQIFRNEVAQSLIIQEINPNRVWQNGEQTQEGSLITMAFNGNAVEMVPGTNYTVTEQKQGTGSNTWYVYTYEIFAENFYSGAELVDGRYKLLFYSEDDAGNKNANETNEGSSLTSYDDGTASGSAEFVLDHMAPVITIIGLSSGDEIMEDYKTVEITVSDNTAVSVSVYVNGKEIELTEYSEDLPKDQVWFAYDAQSGKYLLNITKDTKRQDIKVVALDAAGNEIESGVDEILLTSNWFVQYVNSVPALCITFLVLAAVAVLIFFLIKKKKKEKTAA